MSSALASAKRRSLPPPPQPSSTPGSRQQAVPANRNISSQQQQQQQLQQSQNSAATSQLTLPQVIDVYGRRILQLEKTVSGITTGSIAVSSPQMQQMQRTISPVVDSPSVDKLVKTTLQDPLLDTIIQNKVAEEVAKALQSTSLQISPEWNARYELLAQEIADLKDIVLHLQDYTMSVNKRLLEGAVESSIAQHIHEEIIKHTQSSIEQLSSHFSISNEEEDGNILDDVYPYVDSSLTVDKSEEIEQEDLKFLEKNLPEVE
jgi:hypothetical protein